MQLDDMLRFRRHSSKYMSERFKGYMQTVWSGFGQFMDEYHNGSDKEFCAARNYRFLKSYFRQFSEDGGESFRTPGRRRLRHSGSDERQPY